MSSPQPPATARVSALDLPGGGRAWRKQVERLSGIRRLQKGNATKGFDSERRALAFLHAAGHPVPAILDEGDDFIVLADCGPNLAKLLARNALTAGNRPPPLPQ